MKGMDKISRGRGFAGVIGYAQFGEGNALRQHEGVVIGGNMSSTAPRLIARELSATKKIRPDVCKPVWHNSLRLPKGETLSHDKWSRIGDRYMQRMGFSETHPRVYFLHDDKNGQHIHIIASRVSYDGKLFLGKNENLRSTKIINQLEKEFGLLATKGVNYDSENKIKMPIRSKLTKNEIEKSVRLGQEPARLQLQKIVDQAVNQSPSATQFVESLHLAGVDVRVNIARNGRLNGFTFGLDGVYFIGSKLGKAYTCASLIQRGVTYDKDTDSEFLSRFKSEDGNDTVYSRSALGIEKSRSDRSSFADKGDASIEPGFSESNAKQPTGSRTKDSEISFNIFSNQQSRNHVTSFQSLDPDSGAGPIQTGDRVADELSRKLHQFQLSEARLRISAAEQFWAVMIADQAAREIAISAQDCAERMKQCELDASDERIIKTPQRFATEGFGFAMHQKIKTTNEVSQNERISSPTAPANNSHISADAAPRLG